MPRYFTRPLPPPRRSGKSISVWVQPKADADCDGWDTGRLYDSIEVPEHVAVDTGLLDANGGTIWRAPDPIGFRFGDD